MVLLGGSFAMGTPYVDQPHDDTEGGIASWLQAWLQHRHPGVQIEVINAGAAGQNARRVGEILDEVVALDPDLLVVASCNNEGNVPGALIQTQMSRLGGIRLLESLLGAAPPARSWYTPQDEDSEAIRAEFTGALARMAETAASHDIPLLMATLPVNLRYIGYFPGRIESDVPWTSAPACTQGIQHLDAGLAQPALPLLEECARLPADQQPPPIKQYLAIARLELGTEREQALADLRSELGECVSEGIGLYYAEAYDEAFTHLTTCEELTEGLKWAGLADLAAGSTGRPRRLLEQSVELTPRNRCRPSFNEEIRALAAARDGVTLVDLEAAAVEASPWGVPGSEMFLDYCHMTWEGYSTMALTVLDAIEAGGFGPPGTPSTRPLPPREVTAKQWDLLPTEYGNRPLYRDATTSQGPATP